MSGQEVRKVLLRLLSDDRFYSEFAKAPEAALAEYSLSPDEREALVRRDRALEKYLVPDLSEAEALKFRFMITITFKVDWFNVAKMRPIEELPPDALAEASEVARRVLDAPAAERVDMLVTLLRVLDRRTN